MVFPKFEVAQPVHGLQHRVLAVIRMFLFLLNIRTIVAYIKEGHF